MKNIDEYYIKKIEEVLHNIADIFKEIFESSEIDIFHKQAMIITLCSILAERIYFKNPYKKDIFDTYNFLYNLEKEKGDIIK